MSRPKDIVIVFLALSSSALAFLAWRQHAEIRRLAALPRDLAPQPVATVTLHSATQRSLLVAPSRVSAESSALRRGVRDDDEHARRLLPELRGAPPRPSRGGALVRLMENPEFVQAIGLQRHAMLDARFAALFRRLNLGEAELATFKNLLAEKENVALDVVTVSETSPEGPLPPEALRASVRVAQSQVDQAIQSSLGSERYAIYRDYERTLPQRATVAQLEQRLSYTTTPLTPDQSESLVRVLVAHAPSPAMESAPALSVVVRAGVPEAVPILPSSAAVGRVTDDTVAQAQAVLMPTQITALREIQVEQQAAIKAAALIRAAVPLRDELPTWGLLLH